MAARLAKLSLPATLDTAAAALSDNCRMRVILDLVNKPEMSEAMTSALQDTRPPLTLRCASTARLTMTGARSQQQQDEAAMAFPTASVLREAQPGQINLPGFA